MLNSHNTLTYFVDLISSVMILTQMTTGIHVKSYFKSILENALKDVAQIPYVFSIALPISKLP